MHPRAARAVTLAVVMTIGLACASRGGPVAADVAAQAYKVEITAPAPVKAAVERSLDLVRWQSYAEITPEFFDLLVADARSQARDAAEAQGYFSAKVESNIDRSTTPATVRLRIEPGEPTTVTAVDVTVVGAAAQGDSVGGGLIARLRKDWSLPKGPSFARPTGSAPRAAPCKCSRQTARGSQIDRKPRRWIRKHTAPR